MPIESGTAVPSSKTATAPTPKPAMLTDEGTAATETDANSEDWDIEEVAPSEQVDDHLEVGRVITEGTCEYYVEKVLDYFVNKGKKDWFLVKWWGWSTAHNTWELTEHLEHAHEYVHEFFASHPKQAIRRANVLKYWESQKKKREKTTTRVTKPRNASTTKMPRVPQPVAQDVVDHLEQQHPTLMTERQVNTGIAVSQIPTGDGIMTRARARSLHPELYAQKKACASKCKCIMCDPAPKLTPKKTVPINVLDKKETLKQRKNTAKENVARNKRKLNEQTSRKADATTSGGASRRGRPPKPKKEKPVPNKSKRTSKAVDAVAPPTFDLVHDAGVLTRAQKKNLRDVLRETEKPASAGEKRKNDYALRSAGTGSAQDCQPSSSAKTPSPSSSSKSTRIKSKRGKVEIDFSKHQDWILPFLNQNLYGVLEKILANPDPTPSDAFSDFLFQTPAADHSIPGLYTEELQREEAALEESLLSTSVPEPIPPKRPRTTFIYAVPPPPPKSSEGAPRENPVQG